MLSDLDLYKATVQVYNLREDNMPQKSGSGVVVRLGGKRFLLSVAHLMEGGGRLGVHLDHGMTGSTCYVPEEVGHAKLGDLVFGKISDVDFIWCRLPDDALPMRTSIVPIDGFTRIVNREFSLDETNPILPDSGDYSFAGMIKGHYDNTLVPQVNCLVGDLQIHRGLTFLDEKDFPYWKFKLPYEKHPGHIWFRGCSGAPILDSQGCPVALVCNGDKDENTLTGFSLNAAIALLLPECMSSDVKDGNNGK